MILNLRDGKWELSPVYDINFNRDGKYLHLLIDETDSSLDTDILIDTAKYYELTKDEGSKLVKEFKNIIDDSSLYH